MSLLLSLTSAVCIVVTALITHRIGYLAGKAEVSDTLRGEPSDEGITKELQACGRGDFEEKASDTGQVLEWNIESIKKYRKAQGLDAEIRFCVITDATTKEMLMRDGFLVVSFCTEAIPLERPTAEDGVFYRNGETHKTVRSFVLAVPNSNDHIKVTSGDVIAMNENEFWYANGQHCEWHCIHQM